MMYLERCYITTTRETTAYIFLHEYTFYRQRYFNEQANDFQNKHLSISFLSNHNAFVNNDITSSSNSNNNNENIATKITRACHYYMNQILIQNKHPIYTKLSL